jgi:hypothetical protein
MLEKVMLFLLFFLLGGEKRTAPAGETPADRARREAEEARRRAEQATRAEQSQQRADQLPQAWPVAVPAGLPPFPSGWEYAEPVPVAVKARAWQLLDPLWHKGQGSTAVEMTGGEWITYRAEITKGNKHGIVAYRTKHPIAPRLAKPPATAQQTPSRAPPSSLPTPAPAAMPTPAPALPHFTSTSPGLPQPARTAPSAAPRSARPLLRQGSGMGALVDQQPWVKDLQFRLHLMPVDGKFGANTREAVLAFQRKQGLAADGVVGPNTWSALDRTTTPSAWSVQVGPTSLLLPLPAPAPASA